MHSALHVALHDRSDDKLDIISAFEAYGKFTAGKMYAECGSNHRLADLPTLLLTSRPARPATH